MYRFTWRASSPFPCDRSSLIVEAFEACRFYSQFYHNPVFLVCIILVFISICTPQLMFFICRLQVKSFIDAKYIIGRTNNGQKRFQETGRVLALSLFGFTDTMRAAWSFRDPHLFLPLSKLRQRPEISLKNNNAELILICHLSVCLIWHCPPCFSCNNSLLFLSEECVCNIRVDWHTYFCKPVSHRREHWQGKKKHCYEKILFGWRLQCKTWQPSKCLSLKNVFSADYQI